MKNCIKYIVIFIVVSFFVSLIVFDNKSNIFKDKSKEKIIIATTNEPKLIEPYYHTNHFIVADYILTPTNYDMTSTIQNALNQCKKNGGGTVWLERGIYNVSSPITIPSMCTLMGDWQDPDNYQGTLNYGTKIIVDVKKFKSDKDNLEQTGLIKLSPSSGIEGITIYYKNQNINKIVAQPWSIYYSQGMLYTIKNVTLINSYNGIGRSTQEKTAHEMLIIENVKGTVLNKGVVIHNSSDVGTVTGLYLKPKYWSKANLKAFSDNVSNNSENSISNAIKTHGGMGLIITDAEQQQYVNIELSGFKYGIYIPNANDIKTRIMGSGSLYNLNISNCNIGIMVDKGVYKECNYKNCTMIDYRWGYLISNSIIEGKHYAIYTNSELVSDRVGSQRGTIKLNDVTLKGKTGGAGALIYFDGKSGQYKAVYETTKGADASGIINNTNKFSNLNLYRNNKNSGNNFTFLTPGSSVDKINNALTSIASKGGGVVYLKPGIYKIDKTIIIPSNVELRGSSMVSTRLFQGGTVLNITNNVNVIKIKGNKAGISGINIVYEKNVKSLNNSSSYDKYDYVILAENVKDFYIKNITIAAASHGIKINKCSDFTVENIVTGVLENFILLDNSSNGLIMNCLQNGTVIARNNLYSYNENVLFNNIFIPNTRKKLRYIYLTNSHDIELQNDFTYGSYKFITSINSKLYAINMGYDGNTEILLDSNSSSNNVIINTLNMNGKVAIDNSSNSGLYNIATMWDVNQNDIFNNLFKVSKKYINSFLKPSTNNITFTNLSSKKISYQYDGDGEISCKSSNDALVKCNINNKDIVITPIKEANNVTLTISASKGLHYNSTSTKITVNVRLTNAYINGDVNGDGKVNSTDYIVVRKYILKQTALSGTTYERADVNSDQKVNSIDYITIRKIILKKS